MNIPKKKLFPFSLTAIVVLFDQLTKFLIAKTIPSFAVGRVFFGDFLRIIHVTNKGVAFSLGAGLSHNARAILFLLVPLLVTFMVVTIYFRNNDFSALQRWCICGIVGGGLGNLIDRIFRKEGVIDFIDVKFFGIFGLERWPAFNIADASIVVCGAILIVSFAYTIKNDIKK